MPHSLRALCHPFSLLSSIKLTKKLKSSHTDIEEVLAYLTDMFTSLVGTIINEVSSRDIHEMRSEAEFLFGGWSWSKNCFRIWKLSYSKDAEGFIAPEYSGKILTYAFLGNPETLSKTARKNLRENREDNNTEENPLDMEPLSVLIEMSRDPDIREVDGAIQIAKLYKSGTSEFFGLNWPSLEGQPHFQGRSFSAHSKPDVRYYDPDTLTLIEDQLPNIISDDELVEFSQSEDFTFIKDCYQDSSLREDLSEAQRERLIYIFREAAYHKFIDGMGNNKLDEEAL
ncbi:MAG: hypothetical protein DCF25_03875 [Leptolyngbya foveolarum]|uniref:Uncharacterized protein n=1 Tax=Leptolyngbya foveolarum TaxID=47253 RepID=A0A2W4WD34_9CYAN|nr:MAG: hypothetical protein DCF25_03875 [Leptolyngbya foveolarum]